MTDDNKYKIKAQEWVVMFNGKIEHSLKSIEKTKSVEVKDNTLNDK